MSTVYFAAALGFSILRLNSFYKPLILPTVLCVSSSEIHNVADYLKKRVISSNHNRCHSRTGCTNFASMLSSLLLLAR